MQYSTAPLVTMGSRQVEWGGRYLGELRDSSALMQDPAALHARLAEDGYLLMRGLHDRAAVLKVRRSQVEVLARKGRLRPGTDPMDAIVQDGAKGSFGDEDLKTPEFLELVESDRIMGFYRDFLGETSTTFAYKWMRVVGPGDCTDAHMDHVYMGRGTPNLYTTWTPLGDVPMALASLVILKGSHNLPSYAKIRETYGRSDVDRDNIVGGFSNDPCELIDAHGGRWLTADFRAGDALIFGMHTMHMSLTHVSDRYRLSCDCRYQRASDPVDPRWVKGGPGHYAWNKTPAQPMNEARAKWGV